MKPNLTFVGTDKLFTGSNIYI